MGKYTKFAAALTELCNKHKIAIGYNGNSSDIIIFEITENDDYRIKIEEDKCSGDFNVNFLIN